MGRNNGGKRWGRGHPGSHGSIKSFTRTCVLPLASPMTKESEMGRGGGGRGGGVERKRVGGGERWGEGNGGGSSRKSHSAIK